MVKMTGLTIFQTTEEEPKMSKWTGEKRKMKTNGKVAATGAIEVQPTVQCSEDTYQVAPKKYEDYTTEEQVGRLGGM